MLGTRRSVSLHCDRGHVIVAMVAGAAFTKFYCIHSITVEVAEPGGGLGCLSCMSSMFACVGVDKQSALRKLIHKCGTHRFP